MKKKTFGLIFTVTLLALSTSSLLAEAVFQVSTVQALLKGLYQKAITVASAKKNADTGVGCGVGVGELIAIDGNFYVADGKGEITKLKDSDGIPFLSGSKFAPKIEFDVKDVENVEDLEDTIEKHIESDNIFYVIRVDGAFKQVYARSEDRIDNPSDYEPLLDWMKDHQNKFYFNDEDGSLIIIKSPSMMKNIGVAGYHIHFINKNRTKGGHVFDAKINQATVKIQPLDSLNLVLPDTKKFLSSDMTSDSKAHKDFQKLETK